MLLLMLRNMMWTAWWPYSTMLLALDKAAQQRDSAPPPRPAPPPVKHGQVHQERGMANDAFLKPESPEPLRDLMKMSIEQAKRAFEIFAATSEKTWKQLENSSPPARAGLFSLNAKIAEIIRTNTEASFALAMKLAEAKDVQQAMALQGEHMKKQLEGFAQQLEEMRDLAARIIQQASPAAPADVGAERSTTVAQNNLRSGPGGSAGYASYAPSSSVTPGGSGRRY